MHLFCGCSPAHELRKLLELEPLNATASGFVRSGSAILEALSDSVSGHYPSLSLVRLLEVTVVSVWYLWWIKRMVTHEDGTPPVGN